MWLLLCFSIIYSSDTLLLLWPLYYLLNRKRANQIARKKREMLTKNVTNNFSSIKRREKHIHHHMNHQDIVKLLANFKVTHTHTHIWILNTYNTRQLSHIGWYWTCFLFLSHFFSSKTKYITEKFNLPWKREHANVSDLEWKTNIRFFVFVSC